MLKSSLVAAGLVVAIVGHARADFIGQHVTPTYRYPDLSTVYPSSSWVPTSFIIGPGLETTGSSQGNGSIEGVTNLAVDFAATTLTITLTTQLTNPTWNAASFNGPVFTADAPYGIATAHVDPATTMPGFDDSRISLFTSTDIGINWQGLGYVNGTVVQVDFTFIPEPSSIALFGLALSGLLAALGRRKAQ